MKFSKPKAEQEPKAAKAPKAPRAAGGAAKASKGRGKGRFVMLVGDDGAILVYMQGSTVVRRLFAPSPQPDHTAGMVELLNAHPKAPILMLADVLDQQYVRHSFPPVSSLSVNGLVKRRLDRDFQAEDLKGFLPLGRDKTGRKEWNFLLISLANTAVIQMWMELVVEQPNEFLGVYLVPVESQSYLPALKKAIGGTPASWQILVTHNKVSGFRQVVLKDGKLVFTRVSQAIDEGVAAVVAGNIEQEILNTIEYLRRLGFDDNMPYDLVVVTAQEVKEVLDIGRFQAAEGTVLTPLDVADTLGLQQAALSADRFGDVVMTAWFCTAKKRRLRFMTAYAEQLKKFYGIQRAAIALGSLAALALAGMSAMNVLDALSAGSEATSIEAQAAPLKTEIAALQKSLDSLDTNVAFKSAVVTVHDAYLKDGLTPLQFVQDLAPYIDDQHQATVIDWRTEDPSQAGAAATGPNGSPLPPAPLNIKVSIEFTGGYMDPDELTKVADAYFKGMRENLTKYDISVGNYPWIAGGGNSMEISFNQQATAPAGRTADPKVEVTFRGPKPETDTSNTAAPATTPGAMPAPTSVPPMPGMQ